MRKMLVLDIDGTCITDNYCLSDRLQQTISLICEKHLVCIATGRSVSDVFSYYKALKLDTELICNNGGLVYNPNSGIIRYQKEIYNAENILKFLLDYQGKYHISNVVVSKCNETYLLTNKNRYLHEIMLHKDLPFFYVGDDLFSICDIQRIIISISPVYRQSLEDEIRKMYNQIIVCGWKGRDDIIDISVGSVNKWTAVKSIAEENSISPENIISFGDSFTDIDLLKNSGIGVCMSNGVKEAKEVADYITDFNNNEEGVYHFLLNHLPELF